MNNQPQIERRKFPRVSNNIPLKIFAPDADLVTETKNISCSGAYCRLNRYLEPMTKLKVVLLLPIRKSGRVTTKKISCGGVVVRTENILNEEGFHTAIFFNDLQPKDSRVIAEFVENAISEKTAQSKG